MQIAMSPAAAGLLRALLARADIDRDRILLTEFRSVDWQSLTFIGERHEFQLRIPGPDARQLLSRLLTGLDEADLPIPGHLLADIAMVGEAGEQADGSLTAAIEALTVVQD